MFSMTDDSCPLNSADPEKFGLLLRKIAEDAGISFNQAHAPVYNGLRYEGEFRNNRNHGQGKMTYADGYTYEGSWADGQRNGFGTATYARIDAPATPEQKAALSKLSPDAVTTTTLAGDPITATLSHAPGNGAAIGGLKV